MTDTNAFLSNQWKACLPVGAAAPLADALLADLLARYTDPERHYHNLAHIQTMLQLLLDYKDQVQRPDLVALAIFYHDAIYDPSAKNNEEQSAVYAVQCLSQLGVSDIETETVNQYILATKSHSIPANVSNKNDLAWLLDFDLAILAEPWPSYKKYAKQIRREYSQYHHVAYNVGRRKVLRHFLTKPFIYHSGTFKNEKEQAARSNIRREIAWLKWRLWLPFI